MDPHIFLLNGKKGEKDGGTNRCVRISGVGKGCSSWLDDLEFSVKSVGHELRMGKRGRLEICGTGECLK